MNTTARALHLKISVGAQALQRYPAFRSTESEIWTVISSAYIFMCINFDAASDPQLYSDANWAQKPSPLPLPPPFPLLVPTPP